MAGESDVSLSINLDEASQQALVNAIAEAMARGGQQGASDFIRNMHNASRKAAKGMADDMSSAFGNGSKTGHDFGRQMAAGFHAEFKKLLGTLERELKNVADEVANPNKTSASVRATGTAANAAAINAQALARIESERIKTEAEMQRNGWHAELQAQRTADKLMLQQARSAADMQLAQTKIQAANRQAILRIMSRQLVLIEKAIGAAIVGISKTIAAVGRTALSGVKSLASGLAKVFKRSNGDVNDGLDRSFSKRSSMYRDEFSKEEGIVGRSVAKQKAELQKLNDQTSKGVLGAVSGRGLGMGLAGLVGGIGVGSWLKQGYSEAVNYNEQINKTNVLFGKLNYGVINFASESVKAFGATKSEAMTAIGTFGNLFRAMGFGQKQAGMMSAGLVQLAGDLSSFNNVPIEEAFAALQSGLVGESEPLRRFGVQLNEVELKSQALEMGLVSLDKKGKIPHLTAQEKALSTFALVFDQTRAAQGDFARTSDEGANAVRVMSKTFQELASTIMSKFLPIMNTIITTITKVVGGIQKFITGSSPMLDMLKKALFGVAAGLAAVIAVKGAVEVVKLLGTVTKISLGPLGTMLTIVGLVGGAFAIMYTRSKPLRDAVAAIGDKFGAVGKKVGEFTGALKDGGGNFITDTVLPILDRLATFLAENIVGAFEAVVSFITSYVLPVFKAIVSFLKNMLWPVLKTVGGAITGFFTSALQTVGGFFAALMPLIQPAIDGIGSLVDTIGMAFGGDSTQLGKGFQDAIAGIGGAIANIAGRVGELLTPIATSVANWFTGLFTPEKIKMYVMGVLKFIEGVGYAVGRIVTSPIFLAAVAGIVAAAAVIGFQLIKGIIKGIGDNLPALGDILTSGLKALFKIVVNNLGIVAVIVGGIAILGPALIALFKKLGSQSGASFASGLKASGSGTKGFLSGLVKLPAPSLPSSVGTISASTSTFGAAGKEVQTLQNQLRILGSTMQVAMSPSSIEAAKEEVKKLSEGISDARLRGMKFRDTMNNVKQGFVVVGQTAGGVFKAIKDGFSAAVDTTRLQRNLGGVSKTYVTSVKEAVGGLASEIRNAFEISKLERMIAKDGRALQKALEKALTPPKETILTKTSAIMKSMSDTVRLQGMVAADKLKSGWATTTTAIGVGMLQIGDKAKPVFDGIANRAKVGFDKVKGVAQTGMLNAMYAVDKVVNSRSVKVGLAMASGVAAGAQTMAAGIKGALTTGLANLRVVAAQQGLTLGQVIGAKIGSALVAGIGGYMAGKAAGASGASGAGIGLAALMSGLTAGLATMNPYVGAAAASMTLLGAAFGAAEAEAKAFKEAVKTITQNIEGELQAAVDQGVISLEQLREGLDFSDVAGFKATQKAFKDALGTDGVKQLADVGMNFQRDILPIIRQGGTVDQMRKKLGQAFGEAATSSKSFADEFGKDSVAVQDLMLKMLSTGKGFDFKDVIDAAYELPGALDVLIGKHEDFVESIIFTAGDVYRGSEQLYKSLTDVNANQILFGDLAKETKRTVDDTYGAGFTTFNAQDQMQKLIDKNTQVDEAMQASLGLLGQLFNFGSGGTLQKSIDDALMSVDGLGPQMEEAFKTGGDLGAAKLRENFRSLGTSLTSVIQTGLASGEIISVADAREKTLPILAGLLENVKDPLLRQQIIEQFNGALANLEPVISQVRTEQQAKEFNDKVQAYLTEHPLVTAVEAQARVTMGKQFDVAVQRNAETFTGGMLEIPATVKVSAPDSAEVKTTYKATAATALEGFKEGFDAGRADVAANALKNTEAPKAEIRQNFVIAGRDASSGMAKGLKDWTFVVEAAARSVAAAAKKAAEDELEIKSPSKVFIKIGKEISKGMAVGITSETDNVTAAATSIVDTAVQAALDSVDRGKKILRTAYAELFKLSTGANINNPQAGGMTVTNAIAGVTSATQSFFGTVTSNSQAIWDATIIPEKDRTPQQQNLVGEHPHSLNPRDVTGAANLAAVQQALQSIIDLGTSMLAGGTPISEVVARMTNEVKTFVDNAVKIGFSRKSLNKIVDSMGLSKADLAKFAQTAAGIKGPPNQGNNPPPKKPAPPAPPASPAESVPRPPTVLPAIPMIAPSSSARMVPAGNTDGNSRSMSATERSAPVQNITVNLTLPYGDPAAVALAVSNRIASRV